MKIWVIWTGYVGLIQAVWLSDLWHEIIAIDVFQEKIDQLKNWIPIIYEDGLEELLQKTYKNIDFSLDKSKLIWCDIIFLCVGTPQDDSWKTDLTYIKQASEELSKILNWNEIVVVKSTVPVGTNEMVFNTLWQKNPVASNPEFLREWLAIHDFYNPDRVVLGFKTWEKQEVIEKLSSIYDIFKEKGAEIFITDWETAELIKYAANSFLATKITFINEVARLADKVGANIVDVAKAIWMDPRIWDKFLNAWIGYGWSCFPKDVKSLIHQFKENEIEWAIISKVDETNSSQVNYFLEKIFNKYWDNLTGKTFGLMWVAFKPDTDDLRESRALIIINKLLEAWANLKVFDYNKKARENFKTYINAKELSTSRWSVKVKIYNSFEDIVNGIDSLIITLEDKKILNEDLSKNSIKDKIIFDGKNILDRDNVRNIWLEYIWVGY